MVEQTHPPLINELIATYPGLRPGTPSSWILGSNLYAKQICHAAMSYANPKATDHLITACPKKDDLSLNYIRYLSRGPFRKFAEFIKLEKYSTSFAGLEAAKPQDGENYVVRVTDLDKWPANVLSNFCIATRVPIENRQYLNRWKSMLFDDINENLAFLLAPFLFYGNAHSPIQFPKYWDANHFFFDMPVNFVNYLSGNMDVSCPSYVENPKRVFPTNVIWGKGDSVQRALISGKTPVELSTIFDGLEVAKPQVQEIYKDAN